MEIEVYPDGTKYKKYRPPIEFDNEIRSNVLWHPYIPYHYGLYDDPDGRMLCNSWLAHFNSFKEKSRVGIIRNGVVYR